MSLSTSDMTRIARLNASKTYAINGQVQTKDLVSNVLPNSMANNMSFVGKLKTSRETSKIIDFRASQVADYVLVQEYPGATRVDTFVYTTVPTSGTATQLINTGQNAFTGGFGRELRRTTLCSPAECTTILPSKVILRK